MIKIEIDDPGFAQVLARAAESYAMTILDNATCEQAVEDSAMLSVLAQCLYDGAGELLIEQSDDE
ncbi:hypothetical protein [Propionimicrobium lymphophilum]|nr:hypothetical protein [Propionimicrobium lymphophilum]